MMVPLSLCSCAVHVSVRVRCAPRYRMGVSGVTSVRGSPVVGHGIVVVSASPRAFMPTRLDLAWLSWRLCSFMNLAVYSFIRWRVGRSWAMMHVSSQYPLE